MGYLHSEENQSAASRPACCLRNIPANPNIGRFLSDQNNALKNLYLFGELT